MHRLLVQFLVPKFRALGYSIIASDLTYAIVGGKSVPVPLAVSRHRPDLLGARVAHPPLCIGEAKTLGDLRTRHSREQLADFAGAADCYLVVAIPRSGAAILSAVLEEEGISLGPRFECMAVPDELIRP